MTVKSKNARKNSKAKQPSVAQLKSQLAASKKQMDKLKLLSKEQGSVITDQGKLLEVQQEALDKPNLTVEGGSLAIVDKPAMEEVQADDGGLAAEGGAGFEASTDAQHNPATRQHPYESEEHDVGQFRERAMKSTGPARKAIEKESFIQTVEHEVDPDWVIEMNFMEEKVLVEVMDTDDPKAAPIPQVINDGRSQYFIRGEKQLVKRKFLEILARCKLTKYTQRKGVDGNGDETYFNVPHTVSAYPFRVWEDQNPRGLPWLSKLQAEQ